MVDHGRRLNDPRIGRASALTAAALGAHDTRFLLRLADVQHAFALFERPQVLLRDFVLALVLLESNEIDAFSRNEFLDVADEGRRHRRHCRRRREPLAMVNPQISHYGSHRLQVGHVDVEVHPVDRLVLKHHMIMQYVRHGSCYRHCSSGRPRVLGPIERQAPISKACPWRLDRSPLKSTGNPHSPRLTVADIPRRSEAKASLVLTKDSTVCS